MNIGIKLIIGKRNRNSLCGIIECRIMNGSVVQMKTLLTFLNNKKKNEKRIKIPIGKNEYRKM